MHNAGQRGQVKANEGVQPKVVLRRHHAGGQTSIENTRQQQDDDAGHGGAQQRQYHAEIVDGNTDTVYHDIEKRLTRGGGRRGELRGEGTKNTTKISNTESTRQSK